MEEIQGSLLSRDKVSSRSRGDQTLVITVVLTSLATFVVATRMFTRIGLVKLLGREDAMVSSALVRLLSVYVADIFN
jgi:hypothetical protein